MNDVEDTFDVQLMTRDMEDLPTECDSEEDWDLYSEIEDTMIWTMQGEMYAQEMPVGDDEEFMSMFYPVFEQKWYELVDESQT